MRISFLMLALLIEVPRIYTVTCEPKACQNGGHFLNDKCQCECYPNYTGDLCQIILCNIDEPLLCSDLLIKDCSLSALFDFCPILCQKCPQGTVSTFTGTSPKPTTTDVFSCSYGQIFDINISSCKCLPGFSGNKCEYFDCDSKIQDAEECVLLDCSIPIEVSSCPRQCSALCLNSTSTTYLTFNTTISPGNATTSLISLNRSILNRWFGGENLLKNLNTVNLGNKNIVTIQSATLNGLENIEYLYLNGNKLTILVASVFWSLNKLRVLELWNNELNYLPPNLFKNLDNLEELYLDINQLRDLTPNLFQSGLSQLKILDLSSNKLNKINENVFVRLKNLTYLGLSNNQIIELSGSIFRNLSNLQILNLSLNKLVELSDPLFDFLFQLKELNLESNRLTNLSQNIFGLINNVNNLSIYLNGNPISLNQTDYVTRLCRNNNKCLIKI